MDLPRLPIRIVLWVEQYGKPFVPPVKGNVKGNGEVNCNGKQLTNGKRNDSVNGKKSNNAQS